MYSQEIFTTENNTCPPTYKLNPEIKVMFGKESDHAYNWFKSQLEMPDTDLEIFDYGPTEVLKCVFNKLNIREREVFLQTATKLVSDLAKNPSDTLNMEGRDNLLNLVERLFREVNDTIKNKVRKSLLSLDDNPETLSVIHRYSPEISTTLHYRVMQTLLSIDCIKDINYWFNIPERFGSDYIGIGFSGASRINLEDACNWMESHIDDTNVYRIIYNATAYLIKIWGKDRATDALYEVVEKLGQKELDKYRRYLARFK